MTQNQIRLAEHNENARHNLEMERQGWFTAQSDQVYKDRTGRANLEQAAAASSNAYTNSRNADTNWYNAWTSNVQKDEDQSMTLEDLLRKREELEVEKGKLENERQRTRNQFIQIEGQLYNTRVANDIARQNMLVNKTNAATNRSSMWFSAANSMMTNAVKSVGNVGRLLGGVTR